MGRRGPSPDHAKREAFAKLIAEGVPSARACRMVGINPRTGKRWRNGRRIRSGGRVLNLPPVITSVVPVLRTVLSPLPVRRRARALGRPAPGAAHDARHRCPDGPLARDDQPRAGPRRRCRWSLWAVRGAPACPGTSPPASAQPSRPGCRAARLGRGQAPGTLEPGAGRPPAAPRVPRPDRALAVRRDDLPGRLPA